VTIHYHTTVAIFPTSLSQPLSVQRSRVMHPQSLVLLDIEMRPRNASHTFDSSLRLPVFSLTGFRFPHTCHACKDTEKTKTNL
jgi:hypothetical protein